MKQLPVEVNLSNNIFLFVSLSSNSFLLDTTKIQWMMWHLGSIWVQYLGPIYL